MRNIFHFPPFKEFQIHRIGSLPVRVLLNTEITPDLVALERPEVLIMAVGAEPIIPMIPGIDKKSVILATEVYDEKIMVGNKVAVIGGGLVGCETGLYLAQKGKDVKVIEMLEDVALEANIMHRRALMLELEKSVQIKAGLKCAEITDKGVTVVNKEGTQTLIEADTNIVAVGYKSRSGIVDALRGAAPEFMEIGDCVKPRKVLQAVRTGYDAGMAV